MNSCRDAFEAWAITKGHSIVRTAVGEWYGYWRTQEAWEGWQAALAHASSASADECSVVGEAVAWQVRLTARPRSQWEACTKELYEDTLRTGRYCGLPSGTKNVEVRALYTHPAPSAPDATTNPQESSSKLVDARDAITLMRFIFRHFGDVSTSHHLTDDVVQAARRIESAAGKMGFSTLDTKPIGWYDILRVGTNSGHGHAWARPDGMKARCGGPALCAQCAREQAIAGRRGDGHG